METEAELMNKIETLGRLISDLDERYVVGEKLANITASQLYYLKAIDSLRFPTFGELSQKLKVTKPTVTSAISKLIERGLVQKIQSLEDKRVYNITFTKKGRAVIESYKETYKEFALYVSEILTQSEMETLINVFTKVIQNNPMSYNPMSRNR